MIVLLCSSQRPFSRSLEIRRGSDSFEGGQPLLGSNSSSLPLISTGGSKGCNYLCFDRTLTRMTPYSLSKSKMAATTAALTTIELLEKILLNLSIIDLTLAKRVSPLWHSCIQNSTLLQRKLFQTPIPPSEAPAIRTYRHWQAQPVSVNPLLRNIFRIRHSEVSGPSVTLVPPSGKERLLQR